MSLTVEQVWNHLFKNAPISDLKKYGKQKFLRTYLENVLKQSGETPDVVTRIEMAAIIDVVETRDDPLGGMNYVQTVELTKKEVLRGVNEWIQNYANEGYTNVSDEMQYLMSAHYLGRLEKGTFSDQELLEMLLMIEQTITGGR